MPADRRLQLSVVLAILTAVNFVTVVTCLRAVFEFLEYSWLVEPRATPIMLTIVAASWVYMAFIVVTDDFFARILRKNCQGKEAQKARKNFLVYLVVTIASYLSALMLAAVVGPY
jgi:hypothetical protein